MWKLINVPCGPEDADTIPYVVATSTQEEVLAKYEDIRQSGEGEGGYVVVDSYGVPVYAC